MNINIRCMAIVVGMLIATNTVADYYKMGDLRNAARDKRYNITGNFVRGSTEMWLANVFRGMAKAPSNDELKIRTAAGKCINEFGSEFLTWTMLDQNDKYPDDLPVAVVIASIMDDCLQKQMAK